MADDGQDFGDLIGMIGVDDLAAMVIEVDELQGKPARARGVAEAILHLGDHGDERGRELARKSIRDYFQLWLENRTMKELQAYVMDGVSR